MCFDERDRTPRAHRTAAGARCVVLAALIAACGVDGPVVPPALEQCDGVVQDVIALAPLESRVVSGEAVHCFVLAGGGASYLLLPQLTGATLPYGGYGYRLGDPHAIPPVSAIDDAAALDAIAPMPEAAGDAQARLDALMRHRERHASPPRMRRAPPADSREAGPRATADPVPTRRFSVLATLDATPAFREVDTELAFVGDHVLIYVDTASRAAFSASDLATLGDVVDDVLAPRAFDAFGPGPDIDGNGRVLFVLTPTVNALIPSAECATRGFVRGFFYSHDLSSDASTSNGGEVFYGYVPDPTGTWGCIQPSASVLANLPPTFIHELQHLISFGAHVTTRGGAAEEPWLNEGLSHMAEELGSLHWEALLPAPLGRTDPSQLFPDASTAFITPNLLYSYRFLFGSAASSLTGCAPGGFCSLNERAGTWLLLRWLVDQRGPALLRTLVQGELTGRTNLEAASGSRIGELLGDFAIAASATGLDEVNVNSLSPHLRVPSRDLRTIFARLYETYGLAGGIPRPHPIRPLALKAEAAVTGTMRPGTFVPYRLDAGDGAPTLRVRFAVPDGSRFPATAGAQVALLRVR